MTDNYDDEKMPNQDAIEEMNREYVRVLPASTCEKISTFLGNEHSDNHDICMPNYGILHEVISASEWIVSALEQLRRHTRSRTTIELIDIAIEVKKACIDCALVMCRGSADESTPASTDAVRQMQYNTLYYEIKLRECQILRQVASIEDGTRLLTLENTAMLLLETIGR